MRVDIETITAACLPVWTALSELFLDTELADSDLRRIAAVLRGSGCDVAEVEAILRTQVLPAFGANLLTTAGEWTPWSEDEVRAIMARSLRRGPIARAFARIAARAIWPMIAADWRRVAAFLR